MPLIRFETKKEEGTYLLVTSGEVGWFPNVIFGVTEHLLDQLEPRFEERGIRYHRLSHEEANQAVIRRSNPVPSDYSACPRRSSVG